MPGAPHSNCDVLVVEDDVIQCEEMADYLGRVGLAVETAHDGIAGLRQAAARSPRVALLDYNLPDTTGLQVAQGIRTLLPETAIILMSGRVDGVPEQKLAEIGITDFVAKPMPLGSLRQTVVRLVKTAPVH